MSILTENLADGLHNLKWKDCKSSLEYMTAKDGLLTFKSVDSNKTYKEKFTEDLSKRFKNTYQLCDRDVKKFCVMSQKVIYP